MRNIFFEQQWCGVLDYRLTLWIEENPPLYIGMGEYVGKVERESILVRLPYSDSKAEVVRCDALFGHTFLISTELHDHASNFWPLRFLLRGLDVKPLLVPEGEFQWLYLKFECEDRRTSVESGDYCIAESKWGGEGERESI